MLIITLASTLAVLNHIYVFFTSLRLEKVFGGVCTLQQFHKLQEPHLINECVVVFSDRVNASTFLAPLMSTANQLPYCEGSVEGCTLV